MSILKERLDSLEEKEPWTQREQKGLQPRDKNFIRHIQILYNTDKDTAKEIYARHNIQGKKQFKKLKTKIDDNIKTYYPKHPASTSKSGEEKMPEIKLKPEQVAELKRKDKKTGKKILRSYTSGKKGTGVRVSNAAQKYPDASNFELRKGVNSKEAQKYRLRHGQSREYTGRIIIKKKEK